MNGHSTEEKICSCIKKVIVDSNGKAVIIPDFKLLSNPGYSSTPLEGCFCPRSSSELKKCLRGCLVKVLNENDRHASEIKSVFILDESGKEIKMS